MSRIENEVAVRHQPVAWGSDLRSARLRGSPSEPPRRSSETRLQSVVPPKDKKTDERDPYADVPCTD